MVNGYHDGAGNLLTVSPAAAIRQQTVTAGPYPVAPKRGTHNRRKLALLAKFATRQNGQQTMTPRGQAQPL